MSEHVLETALKDFKRSVEITRDVRFQANLRLLRRQRGSSYIVSLLSLYVIALSLLPNILELTTHQSQILLSCSIILSVFVIFTSLIDGAQNFYHQGELLHQCARKIASVHHELKNIDIGVDPLKAREDLVKLEKEYRTALDECPINHENVDFCREISYKPHLFPTHYPWGWKWLHKCWYSAFAFMLSYNWMFIHVAAIVTISFIVAKYVI